MPNEKTNWLEIAKKAGPPAFPIRVAWDEPRQKFQKKPLIPNWQKAAGQNVDQMPWAAANGFGMLMGRGFYALDVDAYKDAAAPRQWIRSVGADIATRTHATVSGGLHAIFRTPPDMPEIPTRQNIVKGLDGRGTGGFIAFGEGYSLRRDVPLAVLPEKACQAIIDGYSGAGGGAALVVPQDAAGPVDAAALAAKLEHWRAKVRALDRRLKGDPTGLNDQSRSAVAYSTAHLLDMCGFSHAEIVAVLLSDPQGHCCNQKNPERAAVRCAAKAAANNRPPSTSPNAGHKNATRAELLNAFFGRNDQ